MNDTRTNGESTTVLVVEDHAEAREALRQLLELRGYRAEVAANGLEALAYLESSHEDTCLILLDLRMPVMSGWEFRRRQLADRRLAHIPVVVLTADPRDADVEPLHGVSMARKPFDYEALMDCVERECGPPLRV